MSGPYATQVGKTSRRFRIAAFASYGYALFLLFFLVGTIIMQKLQPG